MADTEDLFTKIISLNSLAAEAGQFEVAFHLLAAALHAAEDERDKERIESVIRLASRQALAVEAIADHPMSSTNARRRGNIPLYESLLGTARGKLARLDHIG